MPQADQKWQPYFQLKVCNSRHNFNRQRCIKNSHCNEIKSCMMFYHGECGKWSLRFYFAAPCSGSNLGAIHHRAMMLQSQCQDYLRKAEHALQTVSHNFFFFLFPSLFHWLRENPCFSKQQQYSRLLEKNTKRMTEMSLWWISNGYVRSCTLSWWWKCSIICGSGRSPLSHV